MAPGRNARTSPRGLCPTWPAGPCEDVDAEGVRLLAVATRKHVGQGRAWTLRGAAEAAGVDHSALSRLLNGQAWPDARTILRLERGLGVRLWPEHLERPEGAMEGS